MILHYVLITGRLIAGRGWVMSKTESFVFYLVDEFAHIAFSCAIEPLRIANLESGQALYEWSFASENGETAMSSSGTVIRVHGGFDKRWQADRLFVLSGLNMRNHISRSLLAALRRERLHGTPIGALCSAAYILAFAGMLDGMRTAVHWQFHDLFVEEFPDVDLVPNVFVPDEKIITASGGTATADLMLHLIRTAHGEDLADRVADQMVLSSVRESTAAQKISVQARHGMRNPHLTQAIQRMSEEIEDPLSTTEVAAHVGISTRQLERLFRRYLDRSPSKYYQEIRMQRARNLLLQSEKSVTEIAIACGFRSVTHFSRVYRGFFGVSPGEQRGRLT